MFVVEENVEAMEPTSGRPEKPEPSSPVIAPINTSIRTTIPLFKGTCAEIYRLISLRMLGAFVPRTFNAKSWLPIKKNAAITITGAKILMEKTKPSFR